MLNDVVVHIHQDAAGVNAGGNKDAMTEVLSEGRLQAGGSLSHSFTREVGGGWEGEETGRERGPHYISFPDIRGKQNLDFSELTSYETGCQRSFNANLWLSRLVN